MALGEKASRTHKANFGGVPYVIREPPGNAEVLGIHRGAEWAASCAAARAGVGPPVRAMLDEPPVFVTAFVEGQPVTSEQLHQPDILWNVAGALRRMHGSGEQLPYTFSAFRIVEDYARTASGRGAQLPEGFDGARKQAKAIEKALRGLEHDPVPCHNDLLASNLLLEGSVLRIFGWEYAGMGDRYFDLGNLAVNNDLDEDAERSLLEAYFGEPPDARRLACLRLMRFMSDFREAMWGVVQSTMGQRNTHYHEYANEHFERLGRTGAHPDFSRWLKEARGARS